MMASSTASNGDNRDLECPVCHEQFRNPKMLPCGHSFCLAPCLKRMAKDKDNLRCPECRAYHRIPGRNVEGYPTNIFIVQMLKPVPIQPPKALCPICASDDPLVKCLHCSLLICEICRRKHTRELKNDLVTYVQEIKQKGKTVQLKALECRAKKRLSTEVELFSAEVNTGISSLVDVLQNRKQELLRAIQAYKESESAGIASRMVAFEKELSEFHDFCDKRISVLTNSDSTQTQLLKFKLTASKQQRDIDENEERVFGDEKMTLDVAGDDLLGTLQTFGSFGKVEPPVIPDNTEPASPHEMLEVAPPAPSLLDRKMGPALRCIGEEGNLDGQFNRATCLAVCPVTGNVVVGDSGNRRIQIFDEGGTHVRSIHDSDWYSELAKEGRTYPIPIQDIVVDKSGDILALETSTHQLHIYTEQGKKLHQHKLPSLCSGRLALDSKGFIHICQKQDGIAVITKEGETITRYGLDAGLNLSAIDIVITADDTSYVHDVSNYWDGTDQSKQYHFYVFNKDHQLIKSAGSKYKPFYDEVTRHNVFGTADIPGKMAVIENKYILIANENSYCVRIFDFEWKEVRYNVMEGQGKFYQPHGAAVTKKGELVVVTDNNMLQFY